MSIQVSETGRLDWKFWLWWILASIGGVIVFLIIANSLSLILMRIVPHSGGETYQQSIVFRTIESGVLGLFVGLAQWLVLWRVKPAMHFWVLATILGYVLSPELVQLIQFNTPVLGDMIALLKSWMVLAVVQWFALRGRVHQAGWWIGIGFVGWSYMVFILAIQYWSGLNTQPFHTLTTLLVPTLINGVGMLWLLQQRASAGSQHWDRRIFAGMAIIVICAIVGTGLGVYQGEQFIYAVDPWRSLGTPPQPATKILLADRSGLYVETNSQQIYRCCWIATPVPATPEFDRDCYPPNTTQHPLPVTPPPLPRQIVDRLETAVLMEGCEHIHYAILDDGSVWRWQYSASLLKELMPIFDGILGFFGGAITGLVGVMTFFAMRALVRMVVR